MVQKNKPAIVQHPKMKCLLCKNKIEATENFLILTEFNEGEEFSRAWYHVKCFRDKFISIDTEKNKANDLMNKAQQLMERAGI